MAEPLKRGDPVEVYKVWAGSLPIQKTWFAGYEFVDSDGLIARVKHTRGLFRGAVVRFYMTDVRRNQKA